MELTVIDRVPRKVQIDLPYYCKTTAFNYKVVDEKKVIIVFRGYDLETCGIETSKNTSLAFDNPAAEISTEQEFNDAYNQVINKLNDEKGGSTVQGT
jgi:hypothetical protein